MATPVSGLPDLNRAYPVTRDQIEAYQRDGHVVIPGILSQDEVQAWRPVISATLFDHNDEHRPLEERNTHDKAFLQVWNLWERNEAVVPFVMSRRFAGVAGELTGVDAVRLYHDQALFKEPSGGYTPWHQDQYYWPLATEHSITMWLALVDVSVDMGPVQFASGTHRLGFLGHIDISDAGEKHFDDLVREQGFPTSITALKAGDATFHSGWTLHRAPANSTTRMREAMTIIYYDDGAALGEADNAGRAWDLDRWFPGQKPGEIAGGRLNPLLWKRRG